MGEGALKFFLDCGAHDGSSVRLFRSRMPDWPTWKIHCFEPNPAHRNRLRHMDVTFHEVAVWVDDGNVAFYPHRYGKLKAGSLMRDKPDLDLESPIMVRSIDFGEWVEEECLAEDYVLLKMDIEGAEYRVLSQMVADGSIGLIDEIYIEFHGNKTGVAPDIHEALIADLRARGLEPKPWRA